MKKLMSLVLSLVILVTAPIVAQAKDKIPLGYFTSKNRPVDPYINRVADDPDFGNEGKFISIRDITDDKDCGRTNVAIEAGHTYEVSFYFKNDSESKTAKDVIFQAKYDSVLYPDKTPDKVGSELRGVFKSKGMPKAVDTITLTASSYSVALSCSDVYVYNGEIETPEKAERKLSVGQAGGLNGAPLTAEEVEDSILTPGQSGYVVMTFEAKAAHTKPTKPSTPSRSDQANSTVSSDHNPQASSKVSSDHNPEARFNRPSWTADTAFRQPKASPTLAPTPTPKTASTPAPKTAH